MQQIIKKKKKNVVDTIKKVIVFAQLGYCCFPQSIYLTYRLLPLKRIFLLSLFLFHSFIQSLCRVFFFSFPPLILRWLDLICMHLHNESHLHAQGQTVP